MVLWHFTTAKVLTDESAALDDDTVDWLQTTELCIWWINWPNKEDWRIIPWLFLYPLRNS